MKLISFFNTLLLYFLTFVLVLSYIEQYYFGNFPCPLCILQRFYLVAIGGSLSLNMTWKLYFKNIGLGILSCILGSMVSLYQWSILLTNNGITNAPKIFTLPMYIWAALLFFFVSLFLFLLLFYMDPEQKIYINTFAKISYGLFFIIAISEVISTAFTCGFGLC